MTSSDYLDVQDARRLLSPFRKRSCSHHIPSNISRPSLPSGRDQVIEDYEFYRLGSYHLIFCIQIRIHFIYGILLHTSNHTYSFPPPAETQVNTKNIWKHTKKRRL